MRSMYLVYSIHITADLAHYRDKLRWDVRRLTKHASLADRTQVQEKRQRLGRRILAFHSKVSAMIGDFDDDGLVINEADVVEADEIPDSHMDGSDGEENDEPDDPLSWVDDEDDMGDGEGVVDYPERLPLIMPSSFLKDKITTTNLKAMATQELKLRVGQANDCLERLRLALGHKSLLFQTRVRDASSVKQRTKAWDDVKTARRQVDKHVRGYHRARRAMVRLGAGEELLRKYKVIDRKHLTLSGDITQENRLGQRNDKLAWFWNVGRDLDVNSAWMNECKWLLVPCVHLCH